MQNALKTALTRFRDDARGSMTIEAVLILPIIIWWYLGMLVFFDAYQARGINLKASYTISDMLSRNISGQVSATDLNGLAGLYDYLTAGHGLNSDIRVTMVYCAENCGTENRTLKRDWSFGSGSVAGLSEGQMNNYLGAVPLAPQGERLIMVETFMDYEPVFNVGLNESVYQNVVVTRPRFSPTICLADATCA